MRKFPRVVRLDCSDLAVFGRAAEPSGWAVPGSFAFADNRPEKLLPKARLAFQPAWLGTERVRLIRPQRAGDHA